MTLKTLIIFLLLFIQNAIADVYYCGDIASTGFNYKDGRYRGTAFEEQKFKININSSINTITLKRGDITEHYDCKTPNPIKFNELSCNSIYYMFNINTKTGNYVRATGYGHVFNTDDPKLKDSIKIQYGTCDKFD